MSLEKFALDLAHAEEGLTRYEGPSPRYTSYPTVAGHGLATIRGRLLTDEDLRRRWIIERIMCQGELRADDYTAQFGTKFAADYAPELRRLEPLAVDGLLELGADGSLWATSLGRLLVRNLAMRFDAYLGAQQRTGKPLFSKAV